MRLPSPANTPKVRQDETGLPLASSPDGAGGLKERTSRAFWEHCRAPHDISAKPGMPAPQKEKMMHPKWLVGKLISGEKLTVPQSTTMAHGGNLCLICIRTWLRMAPPIQWNANISWSSQAFITVTGYEWLARCSRLASARWSALEPVGVNGIWTRSWGTVLTLCPSPCKASGPGQASQHAPSPS